MIPSKRNFFQGGSISWSRYDYIITILVFLAALLVRLPFTDNPTVIIDEGLYVSYISHELAGEPFFAPHPPLGRMILSSLIMNDFPQPEAVVKMPGDSFGNFPFFRLRIFNIFIGSLTVATFYILGRMLSLNAGLAFVATTLLIFDSVHVAESRLMLTDVLLWFTGVLGLVSFLASLRADGRRRIYFFVLAAFLFGCAISIKWTGLAFGASAVFLLIRAGWWKKILLTGLIMATVYISFFAHYVSRFESGYVGFKSMFFVDAPYTATVHLPGSGDLSEILSSTFKYNETMFRLNSDAVAVNAGAPDLGSSYSWPLAVNFFPALVLSTGSIIINGNTFSWILALVALVWAIIKIFSDWFRKKEFSEILLFLVAGYVIGFAPFLFIGRHMFIYGYITPLLFAYLTVPLLLSGGNVNKSVPIYVLLTVVFLAIISFAAISPWIYGFVGWMPQL